MPQTLTIALLQMAGHGANQAANLHQADQFCRQATGMGADIALVPEMWNIAYTLVPDPPRNEYADWLKQRAVDAASDYVTHFQTLARELDMAIAVTYLEKWEPAPRNTVSLIDRHGEIVLTYAKVHTCAWDVEGQLTPGDDFYVTSLDTAGGSVEIGAMICFDREFPESARLLMLKGAEIILTPNACELEINRLTQYRARAYENMVGMAMANYIAPLGNGHSIAYDGIAFTRDGQSRDMTIIEAGETEGIHLARFDLDALRAYRDHEVWGPNFRRVETYQALVSDEVKIPE